MKLYLVGVKAYQLDLGIDWKAFSNPRLERTIQGIKRDHDEPERRTRTPLTRPYLLKILSALTGNYYEDVVIYPAFTLAFAGFPRVGEFTYKESDRALAQGFGKWFLTKSCIRISQEATYMKLNLPFSKTDPLRKGVKLTITATYDKGCPVLAMQRLRAIDTHRPEHGPLFWIGKLEQHAFRREYVVRRLQELATGVGLGQGIWNGYSFRRGPATWAAEVGIPENEIQTLGRWRSDAYKAYIEFSKKERIKLSKRFQGPVSRTN